MKGIQGGVLIHMQSSATSQLKGSQYRDWDDEGSQPHGNSDNYKFRRWA